MRVSPRIQRIMLCIALSVVMLSSLTACQIAGKPTYADPTDDPVPYLGRANTDFSLELFKTIAAGEPGENIFISPASISLALAMTLNGAKGETAEKMAAVLGMQDMTLEEVNDAYFSLLKLLTQNDPDVELSIANSLWSRKDVDFFDDFLDRARVYYEAEVTSLDFGLPDAADTINRWVEEQTKGKITDLISPPVNPMTVMFLINAIYFNADWQKPFDPDRTHPVPFYLADGGVIQHPVMFGDGSFPYLKREGFQAVGLPYGEEGRTSMYVFLPDEARSLDGLISELNTARWDEWLSAFQVESGSIGLPLFTLEYETELEAALTELGMGIAFDEGRADFSGMRPTPPGLFISSVKHKAFVQVDEEGTEAAAATSVEIRVTSIQVDAFSMTVDRPFFFAIVDNETGTILFMGSVTDPR